MISVIISSANPSKLREISVNIAMTIGVNYEIIAIDNATGAKSLCAVYNEGIQRATYNLLCFVHEDVVFRTQNWGSVVVDNFSKDSRLGLLGIAGSAYKCLSPSSWWHPNKALNCEYVNILQGNKTGKQLEHHLSRPVVDDGVTAVAAIDGVWMCTTKEIANQHSFDEQLLTGFHGYDLDYSFTIGQHYKVAVTFDVLLEHHSEGHYSKDWVNATLKVHHKWLRHLPIDLIGLEKKELVMGEKVAFKWFIDQLFKLGLSMSQVVAVLFKFSRVYKRFGYGLFISLLLHAAKSRKVQ